MNYGVFWTPEPPRATRRDEGILSTILRMHTDCLSCFRFIQNPQDTTRRASLFFWEFVVLPVLPKRKKAKLLNLYY